MAIEQKREDIASATLIADENKLKCVMDSSVLLSYLNPNDENHYVSKIAVDALKTKLSIFVIPHLVIAEYIGKRTVVGKKLSVTQALELFNKKVVKDLGHVLVGGPNINLDLITNYYKRHSRHSKLTGARFNDFFILTQAEQMKNCILITNDYQMYQCGKNLYKKKIYYLPKKEGVTKDFLRLVADLQKVNS